MTQCDQFTLPAGAQCSPSMGVGLRLPQRRTLQAALQDRYFPAVVHYVMAMGHLRSYDALLVVKSSLLEHRLVASSFATKLLL